MPFTGLDTISNPQDFGFGVHELSTLDQVETDDELDVYSLRYLAEPWSHWMGIDEPGMDPSDPADYDAVIEYLEDLYANGSLEQKRKAESTLSSAFFDADGDYHFIGYGPGEVPWCAGSSGCALFAVNADPNIADATYPLNKANLEWNATAEGAYETYPGLDGEYIDSVQSGVFRRYLHTRK